MTVKFNDLNKQWLAIKEKTLEGLDKLFERSNFILGEQVKSFETNFSNYVGTKYAVGVSNGTDALKLSAQSLDLKGKICFVIPANTYVASLFGPEQAYPEADFKLIDCDSHHQMDTDLLSEFLMKNRTNYDHVVLVPVHLYGYTCDMDKMMELKSKYNCLMIEDSSQSHGATWKDQPTGSFGEVSAFSLYPGKNLGAAGDAGVITTNDEKIYQRLLRLRNLGSVKKYVHEIKGSNHRMDTLQAIILDEKLKYIEGWNESRRLVVSKFEEKINNDKVTLPTTPKHCKPVHHIYPVLVDDRKEFTDHLDQCEIQWGLHYPICIEEMDPYKDIVEKSNARSLTFSKKMVSLPIHPFMSDEEIDYLCDKINEF